MLFIHLFVHLFVSSVIQGVLSAALRERSEKSVLRKWQTSSMRESGFSALA
jgi:hypothetical protein